MIGDRPRRSFGATVQPSPVLQGSVRVLWPSNFLGEGGMPTNSVYFETLEKGTPDFVQSYAISKLGNWILGYEMASRYWADGP
ncbi:hypothetical protein CcaCcLH18_08471 [Colletotrichum camelliae]|nr:hypothetical protein CcaCcLH18_08471 [Colletotrichum camelliae]